MRQQRRIDNADQQLFRQPQLRLWADLQVAIKVGAEDPKLRCLGDVLLAAGQTRRSRSAGSVIRMMEVHCKKLEVDAACALAIISARCSSLTGASVKWRIERWLRSSSMVGVISFFSVRQGFRLWRVR